MFLRFILCYLATAYVSALAAPAAPPPDFRYKAETLSEGMPQPMQLQFAPDGNLFFIEIAGKLRIYKPSEQRTVEAGSLEVTNDQENGLLGMALDPDFARNRWIYFLYSRKEFSGQTLSRFAMKGDQLDLSSRVDLLTFEEQREQCCHHAGALRFGPDGCLYISSGDNTNPFEPSEGYAPIDERKGRGAWDAQKSAANTNDLRGKILRIKPTADGKYAIPSGNLFPPGTPNTRPEIYVMGCRNPWRFDFDPKTGALYFGDVGPDAGGDKAERGPRGVDTINQVLRPGNWGWPLVRGNRSYVEFDYETKAPGSAYDSRKPINNSPNNTGARELPPVQPPLIWYPGGASEEFPILGKGGRTACAGPVFRFRSEFAKTGGLPEHFEGCLLIYDWARPYLKWARLDAAGKLLGIEDFSNVLRLVSEGDSSTQTPEGTVIVRRPSDAIFGPDGCLYLFDYGTTWGANKDAKLIKVSYQRGNIAPVAKASAKVTAGREPLTVELSSAGSRDFEGEVLRFEWKIGDKLIATEPDPRFVLRLPGEYRVELRAIDAHGASASAFVSLTVGNSLPEVRFTSPKDADFFTPGTALKYEVAVRDVEDGESASKPDDFGFRTLVTAQWKSSASGKSEGEPGLTLMKQSDCFNCHAAEQQIVGPPLVEIAKKYRGQPAAVDAAVERVIKGSTGVWGQVPMLPHSQHSADEVHMMVKWIFSLEPGKGGPALLRGLSGEIATPEKDAANFGVIEATYTDSGRAPAGTLTGKATIRLRNRRMEAELAEEIRGPQTLGGGNASGKKFAGAIDHGHLLRYADIALGDSSSVTYRTASGGEGGRIEIRSGRADGPLLASLEVKGGGGWENWTEVTAALTPGSARGDLFVVFVNPGKSGLMNLDWVQVNAK